MTTQIDEVRLAHIYAENVMYQLETWLRTRDKKNIPLGRVLSKVDRLRLLRLHSWSLQFKIPVLEILDFLVPAIRRMIGQSEQQRQKTVFGVSMAVLTSPRFKAVLKEQIERKYPDGEHIEIWKAAEQEKQLAIEHGDELELRGTGKGPLDFESLDQFLVNYNQRLSHAQKRKPDAKGRSMKYRGNPWR
jgi:hypothetical protein